MKLYLTLSLPSLCLAAFLAVIVGCALWVVA